MPAKFANYAGMESKSDSFHYSQAVKVGNIVKISGQGGWDADGNIAPSTAKQVELSLQNVEKALKSVDSSLSWNNVYAVRSYHTDLDASAELAIEGWRRVMPKHRPVWTCVEITKLGIEGMQIEIEVEALVAGGPGDAANISGVGLQDSDRDPVLGQQVGGGQARGPGADDGDGGSAHSLGSSIRGSS